MFDYRDSKVAEKILDIVEGGKEQENAVVPFVFDCIGSKDGSLAGIAKVARKGTVVAVLLPVVLKDASEKEAPEYAMEPGPHAEWVEGVVVRGVRTHFYAEVSCVLIYL